MRYVTKYLDTLGTGGIKVQISRSLGGKSLISRIQDELRDVVQGCHMEFTHALPRDEELVQHSFAAPFVDEEWLDPPI